MKFVRVGNEIFNVEKIAHVILSGSPGGDQASIMFEGSPGRYSLASHLWRKLVPSLNLDQPAVDPEAAHSSA